MKMEFEANTDNDTTLRLSYYSRSTELTDEDFIIQELRKNLVERIDVAMRKLINCKLY